MYSDRPSLVMLTHPAEECPHDIGYYWSISGYTELFLMFMIFLTTFFWNLKVGIAAGIGFSLLLLIKHATRPRIQILGRDPESREFDNAESMGESEFIPNCLIVKIPEPLTSFNTGSLKDRLKKLEDYGTTSAHPALPRVRRPEQNRSIVLDVHGCTAMDASASQVLLEICTEYRNRGTRVIFCRVPSRKSEVWRLLNASGVVEVCGGENHFVKTVDAALRLAEREETNLQRMAEEAESALPSPRSSAPQPEHDPISASFDGADNEERDTGTR